MKTGEVTGNQKRSASKNSGSAGLHVMNLSPCLTMEHSVKNLFLYQDEDLQPKKNQIFLSITVIFLYKTEGGGKKPPLSGIYYQIIYYQGGLGCLKPLQNGALGECGNTVPHKFTTVLHNKLQYSINLLQYSIIRQRAVLAMLEAET